MELEGYSQLAPGTWQKNRGAHIMRKAGGRICKGRGACYYVRMAKPTLNRPADVIAREHTERAVEVIAEAMEQFDMRVALAAAQAMLDRGHGKPLTAIIQVPMIRRKQAQLNAISTDDLLEAIEAEYETLPALPPPAADPLLE